MSRVEALEQLLDQISTQCDVLATFAANAWQGEASEVEITMHMIQAVAERIGAMAALPLDGSKVGVSTAHHLVGYDLAKAIRASDESELSGTASTRRGAAA